MFARIDDCAEKLVSLGVRKGDIVSLQMLSMPQFIYILYALSKIGAVANSMYATATEKEVHDILVETNSKLYVTIDGIFEKTKHAIEGTEVKNVLLVSVGDEGDVITKTIVKLKAPKKVDDSRVIYWNSFQKMKGTFFTEENDGSLPVIMVYTGGTTGKPKAVVLSNNSMNAFVFQYAISGMQFERGKSFLDMLPPFIAFGLTVSIHLPLSTGIKVIVMVDPSPASVGKSFAKYKPEYFVHGLAGIKSIMENPKVSKMDLSFICSLGAGGESIPIKVEKQINTFLEAHNCLQKLMIGYGMTEVGATLCTASSNALKVGTVGIPLPQSNVKIIDANTGLELPCGKEGEICFHTRCAMLSYFNAPEETVNVLRKHDDGKTWVHTGDIGYVDEDGFVSIVGRIKRIITVRENGIYHKVFPKLLEEKLEKMELISSAIVVGRPSPYIENELVAFVVCKDVSVNERNAIEEIKAFSEDIFESYERPAEYRIVDKLPLTAIGKIDFRKLEEQSQMKNQYYHKP